MPDDELSPSDLTDQAPWADAASPVLIDPDIHAGAGQSSAGLPPALVPIPPVVVVVVEAGAPMTQVDPIPTLADASLLTPVADASGAPSIDATVPTPSTPSPSNDAAASTPTPTTPMADAGTTTPDAGPMCQASACTNYCALAPRCCNTRGTCACQSLLGTCTLPSLPRPGYP